jgi:DNA-binding NtrC family response regulator
MSDAILLVDDEPWVLSALMRTLRSEHYEVTGELNAEMALERMKRNKFKVVISDEKMAKMQGAEFLARIRVLYPGTVRVLLTGHATLKTTMRAVNEGGIFRFLTKPWEDESLKQVLREAVTKHDAEAKFWQMFNLLQHREHDLDSLEAAFPGISSLKRDNNGALILPDLNDAELDLLRQQCETILQRLSPINIKI